MNRPLDGRKSACRGTSRKTTAAAATEVAAAACRPQTGREVLVEVLVERLLLLRLPRLLQLLVDHRLVEKVLVEVLEEQTTAAAATKVAAAAKNNEQ